MKTRKPSGDGDERRDGDGARAPGRGRARAPGRGLGDDVGRMCLGRGDARRECLVRCYNSVTDARAPPRRCDGVYSAPRRFTSTACPCERGTISGRSSVGQRRRVTSASTEEIREGRWTAVEIRGSFVFVPCGEDEHLLHRHRQLRTLVPSCVSRIRSDPEGRTVNSAPRSTARDEGGRGNGDDRVRSNGSVASELRRRRDARETRVGSAGCASIFSGLTLRLTHRVHAALVRLLRVHPLYAVHRARDAILQVSARQ